MNTQTIKRIQYGWLCGALVWVVGCAAPRTQIRMSSEQPSRLTQPKKDSANQVAQQKRDSNSANKGYNNWAQQRWEQEQLKLMGRYYGGTTSSQRVTPEQKQDWLEQYQNQLQFYHNTLGDEPPASSPQEPPQQTPVQPQSPQQTQPDIFIPSYGFYPYYQYPWSGYPYDGGYNPRRHRRPRHHFRRHKHRRFRQPGHHRGQRLRPNRTPSRAPTRSYRPPRQQRTPQPGDKRRGFRR